MWTGQRHQVIGSDGPGSAHRFLAALAVLALVAGCGGSVAAVPAGDQTLGEDAPADPEAITLAASTAGRGGAAGALSSGRLAPRTVLLGDGRVLIVGDDGYDPESNGPSSGRDEITTEVEVWDASTNRWYWTASLASPRARFVALPLRDGRALVTGGMDAGMDGKDKGPYVSYSSAWAYNPRTGTWSRAGIMGQARTDPAGAVLRDGRVLVAGGYFASGRGWQPTGTSRSASDGLAPAIELAVSRSGVLADVAPELPVAPIFATAELYNPATNTWSATGSMAVPRFGASAVTLSDGRVLVVGQRAVESPFYALNIDARAFTVAEIYDPKTGRFRLAGTLPTPMINSALVALADGGALLIGGHTNESPDVPIKTTLRFDARALTWTATGRLATARTSAVAVRLRNGKVLVASGYDAYGPTRTAELYDPATGKWTAAPPMLAPRGGGTAVVLRDGSVLIVGGLGAHSHDSQYSPYPWGWSGLARAVRFIPTP